MPAPSVDGHTAQLDAKGRIALVEARTMLGWTPGDLTFVREAHWIILRPAGTKTTNRHVARFNATDRLTIPHAQQRLLGVEPGRRVFVQPLLQSSAIALINPGAVLLGVPLSSIA